MANAEVSDCIPDSAEVNRSSGRNRVCKRCNFTTSDGKEFLHHQLNAHKAEATEIHLCGECDFTTASYTDLQKHRKIHVTNARNQRLASDDSESGRTVEERVEKILLKSKSCEAESDATEEDDASSSKSGLATKIYKCQDCGTITASARKHLRHQVDEHQYDFIIHECDMCEFATKNKQSWTLHMKSHLGGGSTPSSRSNTPVSMVPLASTIPRVANDANIKDDDLMSVPSEKDMYDENSNTPKREAEKGSYSEIKERLNKGIMREENNNKENSAFKALQESLNLKPVDSSFRDNLKAATESGLPDTTAESSAFASDLEAEESSLVIDFQDEEKVKPAPSPAPIPTVTTSTPVVMKPKSHVREAVDPAKYIKVHDTEGVKYACSKCGNLYKWRKSLNKHWKEKHDGEIPTPATSQIFTQLNIPRVNPKQTATALKTFQTLESNGQNRGSPNTVSTIEIFARPSPVSSVKPSPSGLSIVRQRNETIKIPASKSPHLDGKSARLSIGEPFNSYLDKQLSSRMTERKSLDNVHLPNSHRLSFSPGIPPAAHTQSFRSRQQIRTPTPPLDNEPMDLSNPAKPASYNWQQKPRQTVGEVLDLSTKGSKKTGMTPISTPVDFSRRESLPASFGRRDIYQDRFSSPQGSDRIRNCPKCAFSTRSEEAYSVHMEVHLSKRSYRCAQCERVFVTNDELNDHFSTMHYDVVPQFSNAKELSPTTANDAPNMGEVGENLQLYKYLTQNQEQQKQYICMVCGLGYKWKWDLGRHFKNMHPSLNNPYSKRKPTEDDDVQIIDDSPHANKRYRQSDGGNVDLQCKRCSFSCRNQSEMTKHNLIHSLEKTYYCNSCSFNSKSKEEFMLHMRHAHKVNIDGDIAMRYAQSGIRATESIQGDPGKMPAYDIEMDDSESSYPHTPNQIGRPGTPSDSNMLEDGTAIVFPQAPERGSPDLPHTPPRSGGKSKAPKNSSAEMLLPYKCSVCEYRARWPSEITQHMKNHSDEKPFHCPRCSYKSKWKWDVVKHLKRCGGGTVKDVIDTTKLKRPQALNFQNSPGKNGGILSNGPPNVTVMKGIKTSESASSNIESLSVYQAGSFETESSEDDRRYNAVLEDNENSMEGVELSDSSSSISLQDMVASQSPVGKQKQSRKPLLPKTVVGLGQHGCNKCPFIGNSPAELKRHSRVHSDEKPFMCRTCGYSTKWKCDLKKHIRTYDHVAAPRPEDAKKSEKQSGTDDNQQETDEMEEEDVPIESVAIDIPKPHLYKCEKCQYVTYKKNFMDSHMKIHEKPTTLGNKPGGGKFKCKQCTFTTDDLAGFMQHKLVHTTGTQNADTKNTNDLSTLTSKKEEVNDKNENNNKHRRKQVKPGYRHGQAFNEDGSEDSNISSQEIDTMGKAGDLTCFSCPFTTDNEMTLEKHVDNHGSQQRYECEFCDWSVDTLKTLYFHAKSVHAKELSSMNKADFLEKVCAKANSSSESIAVTDIEAMNTLLSSDMDNDESRSTPQRIERVKEIEVNDYVTSPGSPNSTRSKRNRKIRTCQKCGYVTDNMTNLQRHLDKHGQNAKYMCNYCDYSLDRLGLVQLHMKTIHTKDWFASQNKDYPGEEKMVWKSKQVDDMVSESGESMSSQDDVISKKRDLTISKISQYVCPHCPFTTSNMAAFTTHVKHHGSNHAFKCELCDFSQDSAQQIVDHMTQVHGVNPSQNKQLIKKQTKQNKAKMMQKLKLHLNALNARKNYQCALCTYTSFVKSAVTKHKRMRHLKPIKFQCHLCPFNSTRVVPLHQHLAFHKSGFSDKKKRRTRSPSKVESPKVSTRSSSVSSTKSGSTPKGKYVCKHCPYSCKVQAELKKHLKLHEGKLKFKCKHCTYSIDRLHFLQNHEKMHEEEIKEEKRRKSTSRERKPVKSSPDTHQCKQCSFKSTSAKDLENHVQCHGDPNFCHLCPYSNKDPKTLDDHKDKHGSNGRFKCMSCDFAVDKMSVLCQHVKVHNYRGFRQSTLENNLAKRKKCPRCPYHSTSVTDLDLHKQKHLRKNKVNSSSDVKVTRSQANSIDSKDGKKFYYKCTSCPYQTNNKGNFENHRGQHGVEQKLSCPYCDYGSPLTGQLYSHIRIHFPGATLNSNILKVLSSKVNEIPDPGNATAQEINDLESQFLVVEGAAENEVEGTGSVTPKKTLSVKSHFLCAYCDENFDSKDKVINHEKQHL